MSADKIFIHGLHVPALIGCLPSEQERAQPLILDIELYTEFNPIIQKDSIKQTIDYAQVVNSIQHFVQTSHYNLIETLAENLAQHLLKQFKPSQVMIKITKPQAIPNVPNIGVTITRH